MPPKTNPNERTGLLDSEQVDDWCHHLTNSYGMGESHAKFAPGNWGVSSVVTDYEPLKFSTYRVFFALRGTILQDSVLLIEQVLITLIFVGAAVPVYVFFNQNAGDVGAEGTSIRKWVSEQEVRMREFAMIMTLLSSLLLSFYTALAVGRWWVLRTAGVGGIKAAEMELTMLISQMVTQDEKVLQSIRRYTRASLIAIFLWRRKVADVPRELVVASLLDEQEAEQLAKCKQGPKHACLHEVIWAWQSCIVFMLHQQGKIKSDQLFRTLLERCGDGRQAVQVIHTHLAVKIPMQYVHLLGLLVKAHNFVLALIMGALFGAALRNGQTIICVQLFARTLLLPMLFNAILLINAELADPFDGHPTDFPGSAYSTALENDGSCFVKASRNFPNWMAKRNTLPV